MLNTILAIVGAGCSAANLVVFLFYIHPTLERLNPTIPPEGRPEE